MDNMKENKAIKILQRDLQIQLENKALPDGIEAIQIAIQALEKQIEMKKYCDEYNSKNNSGVKVLISIFIISPPNSNFLLPTK